MWSPLAQVLDPALLLPQENPCTHPAPGDVLLFAGVQSEPEILIVYGESRFACKAGALEGNPVLTIEGELERIAQLGPKILWRGAMPLTIEVA